MIMQGVVAGFLFFREAVSFNNENQLTQKPPHSTVTRGVRSNDYDRLILDLLGASIYALYLNYSGTDVLCLAQQYAISDLLSHRSYLPIR
jgi:hypothetical protein